MNYEEMSDFEINQEVARHESLIVNESQSTSKSPTGVMVNDIVQSFTFDPCNNPSDAWPIIEEIWERLMQVDSYYQAHTKWEAYFIEHGVGKLRAAMICFLKMKDSEVE